MKRPEPPAPRASWSAFLALTCALTLGSNDASAWYGPETGAWLNRDPIGEDAHPNLSAFIGNGPIGHFDLLGLLKGVVFKVGFKGLGNIDPYGAFSGFSDRLYSSTGGRTAARDTVTFFDSDGDKKLTKKDCPPFQIKGVGYSWGAVTLLQYAADLRDKVENSNDLELILGTLDPVSTLRSGGSLNSLPPYVRQAVNVFQRNGCWRGCPGQSMGFGGLYVGQTVDGAFNVDLTRAIADPTALGRRRYYDHIAIQGWAPWVVSQVSSATFQ